MRGARLIALALTVAVPLTSFADDRTIVTLIDLSREGTPEREIAHDVARALRVADKLRYRDPDEVLNVGGEDAHATNIRSGRSLLRSARKALAGKEWRDAADELESAVTAYVGSFSHAGDEDAIEEVMALQGAALFLAGDKAGAERAFTRSVEFRPRAKIDLSGYGAPVVAAYDKAREAVLLRGDVTFEVRTSVPNAEVWVNGRYFGLSPSFVKSLAGPQYIRISKHGYARAGRLQVIKSDNAVVTFELAAAHRKPAWDALRERLGEIFDGAVEPNDLSVAQGLLNAGMAVIVHCTGTREKMQIRLALANLAGRQVIKRLSRDVSWLRRDKKVLEEMVRELFAAPDLPPAAEGPEVRTESVFSKWWFWGLVGGVVAGSVTAAVLLGDTEPVAPKYKAGTGGLVLKF
ncbi:MAG: hypothetical protein RIT45_2026 [Pseudomonadota bacterium]|jgi:hypothetical protein